MSIEGTWHSGYSLEQGFSADGDIDEVGTVVLQNGEITGRDPWGTQYKGSYKLENEIITANVEVTSYEDDAQPIFQGLKFPYNLNLTGQYTSLDYFSMLGEVQENPEFRIVINCKRAK